MTTQERDAWAAAYRLYEEYAPGLRSAAVMDVDVGNLFAAALEKMRSTYNATDENGQLITVGVYDILCNVYQDARRRAQDAQNGPVCPSVRSMMEKS